MTNEKDEQELRAKVDSLEGRVDALVTAVTNLEKKVTGIETARNRDMNEIKGLLKATADARVLQEVRRVVTILDGDPSIGLTGMRTTVNEQNKHISDLVALKNRIFWIGLGMAMASGGFGVIIGEALKKAFGP